jgi:hypothetical protein
MSSRPRTPALPRVPRRSASRAVIAVPPPRPRAARSACFTSKHMSLRSFEAEPSTPRPTRTPASTMLRTAAVPRRGGFEVCSARRRRRWTQAGDLGGREVDAVRAPDIAVEPADALEVLTGVQP